jgi:hypothetical protein
MKTRSESFLIASLLLATPVTSLLATSDAHAQISTVFSTLYKSAPVMAVGNLGFSRQVIIGVRVVVNGNTGDFHGDRAVVGICQPSEAPDTLTIEVIDPVTGKVLHVADRWFGDIRQGVNDLKRTQSSACTVGKLQLDLAGAAVKLMTTTGEAIVVDVAGVGKVTLPSKTVFRK